MEHARVRVDEAVRVIFEAANGSSQWEVSLDHLRWQLNATRVVLAEFDFASGAGDLIRHTGYDSGHARRYCEQHAASNLPPCPGNWSQLGQARVGEDIILAKELAATDFYRNWLEPQGFYHRLCGTIDRRGERIIYLEALRRGDQMAYGNEDRRFIESLLPYFQSASHCNNCQWRLAIGQDMLDNLPSAVLAVESERRVLFVNQFAREL
jgi:hypothetical protein